MSYNIFGQYALRVIENSEYYDKEKGINALLVIYGYAVIAEEASWDELERTGLEKAINAYEISTRRVKEYLPKLFCKYPSEKDKKFDFGRRLIDVRCADEDNIEKAIEIIKERKKNDSFSMDMEYWNDEPSFDLHDMWGRFHYLFPGVTPPPLFHLLTGGLLLGAIFMATDMVTSPITNWGCVIFACGCGIVTSVIRIWGNYPEGVSFSILFMNALVPLIDRWCTRKPFGYVARKEAK